MKRVRVLLWILMLLPLVATVVALFFLPDRIPAHYGFDGTVDRWEIGRASCRERV